MTLTKKKTPEELQQILDNVIEDLPRVCQRCGSRANLTRGKCLRSECTWRNCKFKRSLFKGTIFDGSISTPTAGKATPVSGILPPSIERSIILRDLLILLMGRILTQLKGVGMQ